MITQVQVPPIQFRIFNYILQGCKSIFHKAVHDLEKSNPIQIKLTGEEN